MIRQRTLSRKIMYSAFLSFSFFISNVGTIFAEDLSCQDLIADLRAWLDQNTESSPFLYRVSFTYSYLDGAYPNFYTGYMAKDASSAGLSSVGKISRVTFPDGRDHFSKPEAYLSIKALPEQNIVQTRVTGYWTNPRAVSDYEFPMHCLHNKIMYLGQARAIDQSISFEKTKEAL